MRIYLAGPWSRRHIAKIVAEQFEAAGFEVTEPWWNHENTTDHDELKRQAIADVDAVVQAELFVILNLEKSEGKAVETGIALALNKPIIGIGTMGSNIFQHMDNFSWVETVDAAISVARAFRGIVETVQKIQSTQV